MPTCPLVKQYQFKDSCCIKSCKNYSSEITTHCIELVRLDKAKFSDAELHLYKFSKQNISTRLVQMKRKNAEMRISSLLVLYRYVNFIADNYRPKIDGLDWKLAQLESRYPLNIPEIGWNSWMWLYFVDTSIWARFCKINNVSQNITQNMLLQLKEAAYDDVVTCVEEFYTKPNYGDLTNEQE